MFERVAIVSNSRAEAGPLESVIAAMPGANVVGFNSDGLTPAIAMAQALPYFTAMFTNINPKRVIVLGDRYETLAAALAAMFMRIPVAHIHGGETTTGAFDDLMRHSISHIADMHFVAHEKFGIKLKNMGVTGSIYVVGAPGLDGIQMDSAKRDSNIILVTFHPETMAEDYGVGKLWELLIALHYLGEKYNIFFTGVNNDPGRDGIMNLIGDFIEEHQNAQINEKINHQDYIKLMQSAALVIGNSSAGIIEAPWIGVPSVNIGERQNGRPPARSVFNCPGECVSDIISYINAAFLFSRAPRAIYKGGAAPKIAEIVRQSLK